MKLNEIFDTDLEISPDDWQQNGRFLLVNFNINNQGYTIQLEQKNIEGINNAAEISFFSDDINSSEAALSTTDDQLNPLKVYGIVGNAILPVADQYDALLIEADRRHSKTEKEYSAKITIYNSLVQRLNRRLGFITYTIPMEYDKNKTHTRWLISKIPPDINSTFKDEQKIALEYCLTHGKTFIA